MKRSSLYGWGIVLALIAIIATLAVLGGALDTWEVVAAGDGFMEALKDGDYAGAFAAYSPALQAYLGSADQLARMIVEGKLRPSDWRFTSRYQAGDEGALEGSVIMVNDVRGALSLDLRRIDGRWRIVSFDLSPN